MHMHTADNVSHTFADFLWVRVESVPSACMDINLAAELQLTEQRRQNAHLKIYLSESITLIDDAHAAEESFPMH